jgi:hypothetical protein
MSRRTVWEIQSTPNSFDDKYSNLTQMDKLQKDLRQNEELQTKLQEQIGRKDDNLKKHTEVVERLYEKYLVLCSRADVDPRILLQKNAQGIIDVTLVGLFYPLSLTMRK